MIQNPIIRRELLGLLRTPKAIAIQIGFVAAIVLLVVAVWPDNATVNLGGRQARQLLGVFVYGLLVSLMLLAPAFPATTIVRERQTGTLTLLLTSPLSPLAILLGKIISSMGFVVLLLVLSLPAAACCFVMGGVAWQTVAMAYGVLFVVALQYATLGLAVSSKVKTTDSALRVTYGLILLMSVIVLGPYYMAHGKMPAPGGPLIDIGVTWLASLSPIRAILEVLGQEQLGARGIEAGGGDVYRYLILAALSIAGSIAYTLARLQPHATDRPRDKGVVTDEEDKGTQRYRRVMYLWFFDPNRRSGEIADYENPVMMKEFRSRTFGRAHWMARIIGVALIVSIVLMLLSSMSVGGTESGGQLASTEFMGGVMVVFQIGLILLLTPALASSIISGEVESGGWVLLQMTPLSAFRIVVGKVLSVAWTLLLILLATLPGYGVLLKIDDGQFDRVVNVLISLVITSVFALMVGAACSACFKRTAAATTAAYLILIGLSVVTLLPWLGEGTLFGRELVETVLWFNPLAAALNAMKMPGMEPYDLIPINWIILGAGSALCVAILWVRTWKLTQAK